MCESTPEWRFLLSIAVKDHTGMQYLTAFGTEGTQIMGKPADEIRELEGTDEFDEAINVRYAEFILPFQCTCY